MQAIEIIEVYCQNKLEVLDRIDIDEWVTLTLISSEWKYSTDLFIYKCFDIRLVAKFGT